MPEHIVLDADQDVWVDLKSVRELYSGDLMAINAAADVVYDDAGNRVMPGGFGQRRNKALLAQIVTNWSFELPLPTAADPTALDKIPLLPWKRLVKKLDPWWEVINGDGDDPDDSDPTTSSD
jgi:hypothetical protein